MAARVTQVGVSVLTDATGRQARVTQFGVSAVMPAREWISQGSSTCEWIPETTRARVTQFGAAVLTDADSRKIRVTQAGASVLLQELRWNSDGIGTAEWLQPQLSWRSDGTADALFEVESEPTLEWRCEGIGTAEWTQESWKSDGITDVFWAPYIAPIAAGFQSDGESAGEWFVEGGSTPDDAGGGDGVWNVGGGAVRNYVF